MDDDLQTQYILNGAACEKSFRLKKGRGISFARNKTDFLGFID